MLHSDKLCTKWSTTTFISLHYIAKYWVTLVVTLLLAITSLWSTFPTCKYYQLELHTFLIFKTFFHHEVLICCLRQSWLTILELMSVISVKANHSHISVHSIIIKKKKNLKYLGRNHKSHLFLLLLIYISWNFSCYFFCHFINVSALIHSCENWCIITPPHINVNVYLRYCYY